MVAINLPGQKPSTLMNFGGICGRSLASIEKSEIIIINLIRRFPYLEINNDYGRLLPINYSVYYTLVLLYFFLIFLIDSEFVSSEILISCFESFIPAMLITVDRYLVFRNCANWKRRGCVVGWF